MLILEGWYFTGWNSSTDDNRKNKIQHFKAVLKSIMVAQKWKNKKEKRIASRNFFAFLNVYYPKTQLIKFSTILILPYHKNNYYKIKKTGGSRELFLAEYDFQTSSPVNFYKEYPDFGGLKTNRRQIWIFFQFHTTFYISSQSNISWEG